MEEKKFNRARMAFHLVLMALMIAFSIALIVLTLCGVQLGVETSNNVLGIAVNAVYALAFGCGIVHLRGKYGKESAGYYKALLLLACLGNCLVLILYLCFAGKTSATVTVLMAVKILALLALAFVKNLGKRNSWILFVVMTVADFASGVLFSAFVAEPIAAVGMVLSRLVMDGTVGLSLRGKYLDKEARRTT